jgi:outer membrane translocation and assembly module TamA
VEAARDVPWIEARGTAGLSYEVLQADDLELGGSGGEGTETAVTALTLGLTRDRRDNPIRPRSGQRWAVRTETALPELGSEVRYERVELAWSWHQPLWGDDRWMHLGASHGVLADGGDEVPVNKLFFPGGESSIRGYTEGEAAPRDANGRFVGARNVWLVNLEFEQLITGRWTTLIFVDVSGASAQEDEWPGREVLSSAGLGLRYQSPIGPIRLEYGWNLNRRPLDPNGTLHFSIGFPF